jgi:hypothetical protein
VLREHEGTDFIFPLYAGDRMIFAKNNAKKNQSPKVDGLVITRKRLYLVIPVKTGIQSFQQVIKILDTRLRGYDELLHIHQSWLKNSICPRITSGQLDLTIHTG